jgi:hypothetical protein
MAASLQPAEARESWSVTVLYENTDVRQRAMRMCDHLMRQFWCDMEFDFNWWRFSFLEDPILARQAGRHLADADVIIFAARRENELPPTIRNWLEGHLETRGVREGAFIALFGEEDEMPQADSRKDLYLRALAQRTGMEYLTEPPVALPGGLPDSLDMFSERAEEHTSIMENILRRTPPPEMHL